MWSSDCRTQGLYDETGYGLVGCRFCDNRTGVVSSDTSAIVRSQAAHRSIMHIIGATSTLAAAAEAASTPDRSPKFLVFHFRLLVFSRTEGPCFEPDGTFSGIGIFLAIALADSSSLLLFPPPQASRTESRGHFALKSMAVGDEWWAR